jgi:hypothetical protein
LVWRNPNPYGSCRYRWSSFRRRRRLPVGRLCHAAVVHGELRPLRVTIPFRYESVLKMLPGGCVTGQGSLWLRSLRRMATALLPVTTPSWRRRAHETHCERIVAAPSRASSTPLEPTSQAAQAVLCQAPGTVLAGSGQAVCADRARPMSGFSSMAAESILICFLFSQFKFNSVQILEIHINSSIAPKFMKPTNSVGFLNSCSIQEKYKTKQ